MKFVYFLLILTGGLAMIVYREKLQRISGNFAFAEKYLGNGGTFNFYILLGIVFIIFSFLYITGTTDGVIQAIFGRFFFTGSPTSP